MEKVVFKLKNLHVHIDQKEILKGISFEMQQGRVHVVMGPNGSGKSTLAYALLGHPAYVVSKLSSLHIGQNRTNVLELSSDERAKAGLFLAFQSPITIPGVSVVQLLRASFQAMHSENMLQHSKIQNPVLSQKWAAQKDMVTFMKRIKTIASKLNIDDSFLNRGIHDGFSGGEKKKIEMLQALVLEPKFAIFDEIDTGLDVDALKLVGKGIEELVKNGTGVMVITHYQRILRYVTPNIVHILVNGKLVKTGDFSLIDHIESHGYADYEENS